MRTRRSQILIVACVIGGAATTARAQITIRSQEPVVLRASSLPDFAGADITKILLYKRTATGWELIPSQIDEFTNEPLQPYYSGGCSLASNVCERAAKLTGIAGDGFNDTDELAFMARDSGLATTPYDWVAEGVATYRYRISLHDQIGQQYGTVYAYIWTSTPPPPGPPADYVTWTADSSNSQCIGQLSSPTFLDPACGWLRSTDQGSQSGLPRFNAFQAGNWTTAALCVKPYSTDATCTVSDSTKNMLDQFKFRTTGPQESERDWDKACRAFIGVKDGPVRVVRRVMGANSGRYTTMSEFFYGTWFDQLVNVRVHPIASVTISLDHRPKDPPSQETPSLIFTGKHSALNDHLAMDTMDAAAASADGDFPDWVQVDTSRGTYVQLFTEKRKIADSTGSFTYDDSQTGGGEQYSVFQFGQHGFKLAGMPCLGNTMDASCPPEPETSTLLAYGSLLRSWVPLAVDSPTGSPSPAYRSEEGETYSAYQESPIIASVIREDLATASPPIGHCTPSLSGNVDVGGFSNSMTVATSLCSAQDAAGVQVFRGTVPGVYTFLEDLGKRATLVDHRVKAGVTYRYVAKAYNASGDLGSPSTELVLNTVDTVPPPVPTGLGAVAGSHKVIVTWTAPSDADTNSIIVYLGTSLSGPYSPVNLADPVFCSGTTFAVVGLSAGQTYWFRVTARDSHGNESSYSNEVSAVPTN